MSKYRVDVIGDNGKGFQQWFPTKRDAVEWTSRWNATGARAQYIGNKKQSQAFSAARRGA